MKFPPSKSASASSSTSQPTQQLPPQQLLIPSESQSLSPQQQQQKQPVQPWSVHRLNLVAPTVSKNTPPSDPPSSPFPRWGHSLSATATTAGELFLFGGRAHKSFRNDLYVISTGDLSATLLKPTGEVPSPRAGHVCARIGDSLLIWGGASNSDVKGKFIGPYNDSLYLLNLVSREWIRVVVNGPRPVGRFYPTATMVGSKFFVFGGRNYGKSLDDMWALDLNTLKSNPVWESYEPAPGGEKPPPRINHVLVTTGDRIILFGGANSQNQYNDTWSFDVSARKWTELKCTGCIPSPRRGHAAAIVNDVMYVFGGSVDGARVDDLHAFKLSTQQWFMFQNTGPSPTSRSLHTMASDGTQIFVLGGALLEIAQGDETAIIHVFDTKHTKYLNSDPNHVVPSWKTIQLARQSSGGPPTQEQPQHPTSTSSDTYATHGASHSQNTLEQRLVQLTDELPEHADRLLVQTSLVEQKDTELVNMRAKLDELLLSGRSRDQQLRALEQALQEATSRATEAEERSRGAHALVEQKDAELVDTRAKLDELLLFGRSRDQQVRAREQALQKAVSHADERSRLACKRYETELAAVRSRLADAENGWAKSKREADTLRASALTTTDFVSTNEDRIMRENMRRIQAMDAETECSDKNSVLTLYRNEG